MDETGGPIGDGRAAAEGGLAVRRRRRMIAAGLALVVVFGGGIWWRRQVTADPGLSFRGGSNLYRDASATDRSGIARKEGGRASDVEETTVAFVRNGRLYANVGLTNSGPRDVQIEGALPAGMFYWGFERMSLAADALATLFEPFRPFTLRRGETRQVRLEFRLADCDPPGYPTGGYSTLVNLLLRYRVLGVTRTAEVTFPDHRISLQATGDCANAIIDHR